MSTATDAATTALDVLADVAQAGVSIALDGRGALVIAPAPTRAIPAEIRALVRAHRLLLMAELERRGRTVDMRPAVWAWLCVDCQERYPARGRPDRLCAFCAARRPE